MSHSSSGLVCKDEDGSMRQHGEKWNRDDCTRCKCRVSVMVSSFVNVVHYENMPIQIY